MSRLQTLDARYYIWHGSSTVALWAVQQIGKDKSCRRFGNRISCGPDAWRREWLRTRRATFRAEVVNRRPKPLVDHDTGELLEAPASLDLMEEFNALCDDEAERMRQDEIDNDK